MSEIQYYVPIEGVEIERDSAGVNTYDAEGNPMSEIKRWSIDRPG